MSTTISVRDPAARDMTADLFADITPSRFTVAWSPPILSLTFEADLTNAQILSVKLRLLALDVNEETILRKAWDALQTNRDFYQATTHTNLQMAAEVEALARQMNGVLRRLLGLYDGTG